MFAPLMNGGRIMQHASRLGFFCVRHLVAALLTVSAGCLLWTVIYFVLLLWAGSAGGGMGSPLTYPIGLLLFLVAGAAVSLALLFPATALAECLARWLGFPILVQIPLGVAFLALLCLAAASIQSSISFNVLFLSLLLPMGLYWWVAQSAPLACSLLRVIGSAMRRADSTRNK